MKTVMLYGLCRKMGYCLEDCGLCADVTMPGERVEWQPMGKLPRRAKMVKRLICGYHTGQHKKSCYGYTAAQRLIDREPIRVKVRVKFTGGGTDPIPVVIRVVTVRCDCGPNKPRTYHFWYCPRYTELSPGLSTGGEKLRV